MQKTRPRTVRQKELTEEKMNNEHGGKKCSQIHFALTVVKHRVYLMATVAGPSGTQLPVRLKEQQSTPGSRHRLVTKQRNSYREGTTRYHRERHRLLRLFFSAFFFLVVSSPLPPSCLVGVVIGGSPPRGRAQTGLHFLPHFWNRPILWHRQLVPHRLHRHDEL